MARAILSFYTVGDADNNPTETLLHEDIGGDLQSGSKVQSIINGVITNEIIKKFIFFPDKYLETLTDGMKVTSSTATYLLDYVDDYDETQEIILREKG